MKLHFDSNQEYQIEAIKAVTDIFEGQPMSGGDFEFSLTETGSLLSENGVGNRLTLTEEQIWENVKSIQQRNLTPAPSPEGEGSKGRGRRGVGGEAGMNFSVEMETGTGKTYVYLRTIYELNKLYGFKKYVIVVPSIAIREGVLKNLQITHEHFQTLYDKAQINYDVYDSKKVSHLRGFAAGNAIQILVINIDAFAKDENIINKPNDKLTGKKPIEFIQSINPIVIVDEPQNMETDIRKKAIENLNPLCTLRYSATHTNLYNLMYSLNPVKAYDLGLVKQIEVDSVVSENAMNEAFLQLESINATKTKITAKIKIDCNSNKGVVKKSVSVKTGDDIYRLSKEREIYKEGFIIDEIDAGNDTITLTNGSMLSVGESQGGMNDEVMKYMIRKTVEEHLKKERVYKGKGIKVLSLFFIDKVRNYREYDANGNPVKGKFAGWFEEIYNELAASPLIPLSSRRGAGGEVPDMLAYIQSKTELTRHTILEILKRSGRLNELLLNPQLFMDNAVVAIKSVLYELMVDGIKYEKIGNKIYEMALFEDNELEIYLDQFTFAVDQQEKTIYENYIPLDSTVENQFARDCESSENIEFFFKLPFWFRINTPIGTYNSDWAIVFKGKKKVYFVAETKSKDQELRLSEKMKIDCGKAHFKQFDDVTFKGPISSVSELT